MTYKYVLIFLLTILNFISTYGSKINFQATPSEFTPTLTRSVVLHCGLNDTIPNTSIVGRDLTSTPDNAQHVTAVVLTRGDGSEVATITQYTPAKSMSSLSNVGVTGRVGSSPGERGYLEVTLQHPPASAAGAYICKVDSISDEGHLLVFTQTLNLTTAEPSIDALVKHISDMETKQEAIIANQTNEIKNLQTLVKNQQDTNNNQTSLILKLQTENTQIINTNNNQTSLIQKLQTENTQINNKLNIYKHIEHGTIRVNYLGGSNPHTKTYSQMFTTPYINTPDVTVAIRGFYMKDVGSGGSDTYKEIDVYLQTVDKTGFTVEVYAPFDYVYYVDITWFSFPK